MNQGRREGKDGGREWREITSFQANEPLPLKDFYHRQKRRVLLLYEKRNYSEKNTKVPHTAKLSQKQKLRSKSHFVEAFVAMKTA